jgi:hypothetical protein
LFLDGEKGLRVHQLQWEIGGEVFWLFAWCVGFLCLLWEEVKSEVRGDIHQWRYRKPGQLFAFCSVGFIVLFVDWGAPLVHGERNVHMMRSQGV